MENTNLVQIELPVEVAEIAKNVSVEKRNEVQSVLNHIFNGVSKMREQLDNIVVADENDKINMKLANTIRLGVRQVRLEAEKTFDAKRAEVQQQMLSFKTEDSLWLKGKQVMQILTKEIEENAKWKEETKARFDSEQRELRIQQRIFKLQKIESNIPRIEFENMSDESFDSFFNGLEKSYNDKIQAEKEAEEARIEQERINNLHQERYKIALPYFNFWSEFEKTINFGTQSESDFKAFMNRNINADNEHRIEQAKIKAENERLKKEAEGLALKVENERKEAEAKLEEEKRKAKEEADKLAEKLRLEREEAERKAKAIEEESQKKLAEAEALRKKQADEMKVIQDKIQQDRANSIKEENERKLAEENAKKAPLKEKVLLWIDTLSEFNKEGLTPEELEFINPVISRLVGYKKWAKEETNKL